jgi:hypothetical protein
MQDVANIGNYAFYGCSGLTSIINFNAIPQRVNNSFVDVYKDTCVLRVPANAVSAYKIASGWMDFKI